MNHNKPEALMLFAAGLGTRMGALTAHCPKPLVQVAGKPLIDHSLAIVEDAAIRTVVVNTHYLSEMMVAHLQDRDVFLSHEPDVLETGGGLRNALPLLGPEPVFTFNSDAVWAGENPLLTLARNWQPEKMDALLLLVPRENALGHNGKGDFIQDQAGRITRGPGLIYSGAQIIRTEGLAEIPEEKFSLNVLWDRMITKGRLFSVVYNGKWCDVGRPESIALATELLESAHV
ncbi:MAG TPA: nucleotidyltransferase family protein [Rhodobacteraceae bacterium]|nr:nucleotidyltransferase family protein [Paracoccaceae bacterium]